MGARGRDHQDPVAGLAVCRDGFGGVTENDRLDVVFHPGANQMLDLLWRAADHRLQAEGHVVFHAQFAVAVGIHQLVVLSHERLGVDPAQATHLLAPKGGAVAVDQGFVQIKNCQGHRVLSENSCKLQAARIGLGGQQSTT
ncbi:hypothetical protein D3C76_1438320 [compost metagenome]